MKQPQDYVLTIEDLWASYSKRNLFGMKSSEETILRGINMEIPRGGIIGLVGESGSGKTTLAKCILRILKAKKGSIKLNSLDIIKQGEEEMESRRTQIQMLFQNPYSILNPKMTVEELLFETCDLLSKRPDEEKEDWIIWILKTFGILHRRYAFPNQLSGGERRRVSLARILLTNPDLVIADEPVAGLDSSIKSRVLTVLWQMKLPTTAYLIISHDLQIISSLCDEIYVIYCGQIVERFKISKLKNFSKHHPYTVRLLEASFGPNNSEKQPQLFPPSEETKNLGCPYRKSCKLFLSKSFDTNKCDKILPKLKEYSEGISVSCHYFEEQEKLNTPKEKAKELANE